MESKLNQQGIARECFYPNGHYEYDRDANTLKIFMSLLDEKEYHVGGSSQKSKKSL